ncbi:DUF2530 domain-containing protein [Isoptericola sp. BMS4]|uniref:DUF2530 domain-containing protein n=1 Tax=Isoptericola sp. BMS4 TaxID=2527875 RepID=UPI00196B3685|nr:DUF2530 domain-containing protein [Isoptericola sp. BMS4]
MPSIMTVLTRPERRRPAPPPLRVDLRRVLLAGIVLWAVALVVSVVLLTLGRDASQTAVTCAVGILLGGLGLLWERSHRAAYRGEE